MQLFEKNSDWNGYLVSRLLTFTNKIANVFLLSLRKNRGSIRDRFETHLSKEE